MKKLILIIALLLGMALSANTDTGQSFIKIDGQLIEIKGNTFYKADNGDMVELKPITKEVIKTRLDLILEESNRLLAIDIDQLILDTAPREELLDNIKEHRLEIAQLKKTIEVISGATSIASGAYALIVGNIVRTGIVIATSAGTTIVYAPIVGGVVMVAGVALTVHGAVTVYKALKD